MNEKLHIALTGRDDVLAAILAEQAGAKNAFDFSYLPQGLGGKDDFDVIIKTLPALPESQPESEQENTLPVFFVLEKKEQGMSAPNVFYKPIKLAAFLDDVLTTARLRCIKQPRLLAPGIFFNPFQREIVEPAQKRCVLLTEKEAQFLLAVLDAGRTGLSRSMAMTQIWGYHPEVDSHAVDTNLYRLRQKMLEIPVLSEALRNEGGVYKWGL